jgi:hypothetical protein
MLQKLSVPTQKPKELISKYFNENTIIQTPLKKRKHNPYFSNILCKFYAKNSCAKGDQCIFSHDISQFPCVNGKNCKKLNCEYRHDIECIDNTQDIEKVVYMSPFGLE